MALISFCILKSGYNLLNKKTPNKHVLIAAILSDYQWRYSLRQESRAIALHSVVLLVVTVSVIVWVFFYVKR